MVVLLKNILYTMRICLNHKLASNNLLLLTAHNNYSTKSNENQEQSQSQPQPQQQQQQRPKTTTGKTKVEATEAQSLAQKRSLHVAVIGVPNAGKSTFINNLIHHRVCPTSSKVHTTRKANKAIYTTGNTQLVFYDTPGLVTQREINKHHLESSFRSAYRHAIQHADMIAVMQDVSNVWTRNKLHATVMESLQTYTKLPSILILNKIDALKSKRILLELIRILTNDTLTGNRRKKQQQQKLNKNAAIVTTINNNEQLENFEATAPAATDVATSKIKYTNNWSQFSEVYLVSSLIGSGLNEVHDYLIKMAKPRNWEYSSDTFTDETPESLVVASVRARLLDYLPQEIPYTLKSAIEYYSEENNTIYASVLVQCPTPRIERLICGESNGKLRQITERVTSDLVETFGKPISLTIATNSKKEKDKDFK